MGQNSTGANGIDAWKQNDCLMNDANDNLRKDRHVAVVGAGLIGAGWAIVFARAGFAVRAFDAHPQTLAGLRTFVANQLETMMTHGLVEDAEEVLARIEVSATLERAVSGAGYVQESVLERVDVKRELMQALATCLDADAVVGSSTSGIGASKFTQGQAIADRVLVVHPVNPPHLVPVVELVPSPWTSRDAVAVAKAMMEAVGQSVVLLSREIEGFVLNRLQGALLREAWALVQDGIASCEDIDKTVKDGLGWRWSFMGPFETIDLNAPGGVADYAQRLGPLYRSIAASRKHDEDWSAELIAAVERQRDARLPRQDLAKRRDWRDEQLMVIASDRRKRGKA